MSSPRMNPNKKNLNVITEQRKSMKESNSKTNLRDVNIPKKNDTPFVRKRNDHMKKLPKRFEAKENFEIKEAVKLQEKKKTPKEINIISKSMKDHFFFFAMSDVELEHIVEKMLYCEAKADTFLFKQGDDATLFFIIEKGSCQVIINDTVRRQIGAGEYFGDLALLYNAPRSASIKTLENSTFWAIDRNTFRNAMEELSEKNYTMNREFIEGIKLFRKKKKNEKYKAYFYLESLTSQQKDGIATVLTTQRFVKHQNIVTEGDPGSSYYIIKEGSVSVLKGKELKEVRKLIKGEAFGEQALYYNTNRTMTCRADLDNTICLALGREMMLKILGDGIQVIILRNTQRWAIQKSEIFSNLTKIQVEKVLDRIKLHNYKAKDLLVKEGTVGCPKLFIVMDGIIKGEKGEKIEKGGIFGDSYFLEENRQKKITENIIVDKDASIGEITFEEFEECIGGKLEAIIKKNETSHERKMTFHSLKPKVNAENLKLTDLYHIKKLGSGQFGNVHLVKPKNSSDLYALKCVSKNQIIVQNLEVYVQREREVCSICDFPFIMQFIRTYKDDYQVYFLLEFIKGMELFDVIREIGLLKIYDCQFYVGAMILAIEYLHAKGIVYRDLKPENIMVDDKGCLKLIDMGTAKFLKGKNSTNRTFTIIGTPHYMAPEIIAGKGYGFNVDLWSIGVCLYEFLCGMVPFGEESEDPYEIYEEIVKKNIKYPHYVDDKKAKKIIDQLLNKIPELRLGASFAQLKSNLFFSEFDWDALHDQLLKPPFFPSKEKLISEKFVETEAAKKKIVLNEIKKDNNEMKNLQKTKSKIQDWDKDF